MKIGEPAEENEFLVRRALKRASKRARQKKKKAALKAAAAATAGGLDYSRPLLLWLIYPTVPII